MIIDCPNCSSRFVVKSEDIGENGRNVKCSKCGHKWFEQPIEETIEEFSLEKTDTFFDFENIAKLGEYKRNNFLDDDEDDTNTKLEAIKQQIESDDFDYEGDKKGATCETESEIRSEPEPEPVSATKPKAEFKPIPEFKPTTPTPKPQAEFKPQFKIEPEPINSSPTLNFNSVSNATYLEPRKASFLLKIIFTISLILLIIALLLKFSSNQPEFLSMFYKKAGLYNTDELQLVDVDYLINKNASPSQMLVTGKIVNNSNYEKQYPNVRISTLSYEGKVIKQFFLSPKYSKINPSGQISFDQIITDIPLNTDRVIIDLGNNLEILQR